MEPSWIVVISVTDENVDLDQFQDAVTVVAASVRSAVDYS